MKTFDNLGKFAEHLAKTIIAQELAIKAALEKSARIVEREAKREIGHLQPEVGPFQDWEELADSTKEDKERKGYVFNSDYNPLLRTGELRNSISHEVKGHEAAIGSTSQVMVYQEFGTSKIPPRAVLGPAIYKNKEIIKIILGSAVITGIIGHSFIHPSLGYDMET